MATLLEGTTTISWPSYLWLNLAGSAAYTTVYILLGYFLGKKWKLLQAWLGPTALYAIMAAIALIFLGVVFRKALLLYVARFSSKRPK